jgi:hypothetical protein
MNEKQKSPGSIIRFDKRTFDEMNFKYLRKKKFENKILDEMGVLGLDIPENINQEFYENLFSHIFELIEIKYQPQNQLGLSGLKLVQLKEIDLNPLKKVHTEWLELIDIQKPNEDEFKIYCSNEEEEARLDVAKRIIKSFNDLKSIQTIYPLNVIGATNHAIGYDFTENVFVPMVEFVKNIQRRSH